MWRAVSNVMTTYACISLSNQGILAGMRPCGIVLMLHELFTAESKTQVYGCLHNYYSLHPSTAKTIGLSLPQEQTKVIHMYVYCAEFICYDDACHLRKYARNPNRIAYTEHTKQLASVEMVVDKMHMKGHIDPWCLQNCNPSKFESLHKVPCLIYMFPNTSCYLLQVDTEVCEQVFSWLSRYSRITQKMSQDTFMFFLLCVCDLHNIREEQKLQCAGFF